MPTRLAFCFAVPSRHLCVGKTGNAHTSACLVSYPTIPHARVTVSTRPHLWTCQVPLPCLFNCSYHRSWTVIAMFGQLQLPYLNHYSWHDYSTVVDMFEQTVVVIYGQQQLLPCMAWSTEVVVSGQVQLSFMDNSNCCHVWPGLLQLTWFESFKSCHLLTLGSCHVTLERRGKITSWSCHMILSTLKRWHRNTTKRHGKITYLVRERVAICLQAH